MPCDKGRVKGLPDKGFLGWQFLDEEERVLCENDRLNPVGSDAWTWQANYLQSRPQWDTLRVQLNVIPHAGVVSFEDVMLVELDEPRPS